MLTRKHKRRLFGKANTHKESGEMSLQITSMADIFTILLVFLLKGVASDAIQINPSNGTQLPMGIHTTPLAETALQLEISKTGILVEKEFVSAIDEANSTLPALQQRLSKERERQKIIAQANNTVKVDPRVIVISDQSIPFANIKPILRTLASQGYSEIKFAVVNNEK